MIRLKAIDKKLPTRPEEPATSLGLTDQLWGVLEKCWTFDPDERPDISSVLRRLQEFTPAAQFSTSTQNYLAVLRPLEILVSIELGHFRSA